MADGFILFRKSRELEMKMTTFLLNIIQSGFLFSRAWEEYLNKGITDDFTDLKNQVSTLEAENDRLRREIESQLYVQMILPDMRSDILQLIEGCDRIINKYESDLILLSIEKIKIPVSLKDSLYQTIETSTSCVSTLISGVKSFFAGTLVNDFVQQVYVLEQQVDLQAIGLKQMLFTQKKFSLARQLQLKEFVEGIEKISDMAEDMADTLSVMAVKHIV